MFSLRGWRGGGSPRNDGNKNRKRSLGSLPRGSRQASPPDAAHGSSSVLRLCLESGRCSWASGLPRLPRELHGIRRGLRLGVRGLWDRAEDGRASCAAAADMQTHNGRAASGARGARARGSPGARGLREAFQPGRKATTVTRRVTVLPLDNGPEGRNGPWLKRHQPVLPLAFQKAAWEGLAPKMPESEAGATRRGRRRPGAGAGTPSASVACAGPHIATVRAPDHPPGRRQGPRWLCVSAADQGCREGSCATTGLLIEARGVQACRVHTQQRQSRAGSSVFAAPGRAAALPSTSFYPWPRAPCPAAAQLLSGPAGPVRGGSLGTRAPLSPAGGSAWGPGRATRATWPTALPRLPRSRPLFLWVFQRSVSDALCPPPRAS